MQRSVILREVLPAAAGYLALIAAALVLDGLLHRLGLGAVGRYLGIVGTALILLSFLYSARKRSVLKSGSPRGLLRAHEGLSWLGALAVLVHAGVHVNAVIPWLAVGAMVVVVGSGATGSVLLKRVMAASEPPVPVLDGVMMGAMKRWRQVHLPLNAAFLVLALVHVVTAVAFWTW